MVVADDSLAQQLGDGLEHYILTLMSIANRVFSHPSLGSAVSISVVKVLYILWKILIRVLMKVHVDYINSSSPLLHAV